MAKLSVGIATRRRESPGRRRGASSAAGRGSPGQWANRQDMTRKQFETELLKLQRELVIMQEYVKAKGLRIVVIFEGATRPARAG